MRIVLLFVAFLTAAVALDAAESRGRCVFVGEDSSRRPTSHAPHSDGMRLAAAAFLPQAAGLLRT